MADHSEAERCGRNLRNLDYHPGWILFQDWCPDCQSRGFPTLKKLTKAFGKNDSVKFLAVQTVFEGHDFNTEDKLRKNQLKFGLKIPMDP